jgi:hypothetical protein
MQYFSEKDLLRFDESLKDIEHHAQDNAHLLKRLDRYSISVKGDLTYEFHFENISGSEIEIIIPPPCRPKDIPELGIEDPRRVGLGIKRLMIKDNV